jgi:hypothetical protein
MKKYIVLSLLVALGILLNKTYLQGVDQNIENQDMPERSAIRDFEMMKDPVLNRIPFERYPVARRRTQLLLRNQHNIHSLSWVQVSSDMGGRTKTLCLDPNDAAGKTLWAGAATGGLWKNTDIDNPDNPWIPVSDVWETLSVSAIAFDPVNPQIIYVGTGEYETAITGIYRESSGRGYGIWKSVNGGQSFQRLLSTADFAYISDLVIKNESGQTVIYAGVLSGIYRGTTFSAQPSEGLFRSFDGGNTWQQVLPDIPGTNSPYAPSDIEIAANGKIYVGTKRNLQGEGAACILTSDTGNPGSWSVNNQFQTMILSATDFNIPGRVKLAAAPSNPNKVYAVFAAKSTQQTLEGFPQTIGKIVAKTTDGGNTWQQMNNPVNVSGNNWAYLAWHALSISVDPNNENRVFAGGLDVYMSDDGAQSWQQLSDWSAMYYGGGDDYVHADIHHLLFDTNNSSRLFIATDGGVFYSDDAGSNSITFQSRNKSYATLQFYSAAISKSGLDMLAGGLQDNGTIIYLNTPITENNMIQGGDGAFCFFDDNENILISSTYDNRFQVYDFDTSTTNRIYSYTSGLFTTTFDYDSQNNIIWAIASDLHDNRLDEVLKLTDILNSENGIFVHLGTGTDKYFSAIRLVNNDNMIIGTANGKLYKVSNINTNPVSQEIDGGNFNGFISSIQTGDNGQRILITVSNYGVESVWQTLNGGATWTNVEGNLPDIPVRWAIYHPQNPNRVMLATETGVWTTDNINVNPVVWIPQQNGFPNVRVDMLDINPSNNKVVAGTHGRTMFTTIWDDSNSVNDLVLTEFKMYPNPATNFVNIEVKDDNLRYLLFDLNGKLLLQGNLISGKQQIDISVLSGGYYLMQVGNEIKKLLVK